MEQSQQNSNEQCEKAIRVLVVDDQRLVLDGIASLLSFQKGLTVVGTAVNGADAVEQVIVLQPEVVLMDVRMPVMNGVEATTQILKQHPECCILMLTTFDDDVYVRDALHAGARGYLLKNMPIADLTATIFAASKGTYQLNAAVIEHFIDHAGTSAQTAEPSKITTAIQSSLSGESATAIRLTRREQEILSLIATGATNREVAEHLIISEGTVKNHLARLFSRLGLRDRTQAVVYAREHELL